MSDREPAWSVVVGATGALGTPIVARLVAEGHRLLAVARSTERLAELCAAHPGVDPCPADFSSDAAGDRVVKALGGRPVRFVVYGPAAGMAGGILDARPPDLLAAIDLKVNGLLRLVRALRPRFAAGARVVALGGNLAYDPTPDAATSGLANAALANAVRQLQRAVGPEGPSFHVVAPGPVLTPRYLQLAAAEGVRRAVDPAKVIAEAEAAAPVGRLTRPHEVAWAVARMADPEATALAGSTLLLDGGRRTAIP